MKFKNDIGVNWEKSYYEMWVKDKETMITIMQMNMSDDIKNGGFNPNGKNIRSQVESIHLYKLEFNKQLMEFAKMTDAEVNRWCYFDMKVRGVI